MSSSPSIVPTRLIGAAPPGLTRAAPTGLTRAAPTGLTRAAPTGLTGAAPTGVTRAVPTRAPVRLSDKAAFVLFVSRVVSFISGAAAPTPLYSVYQAAWGCSPVIVTVVFGVYAVAVLATLLVAGALSDHVGRRPVLVVATAMQIVAMAMFARANGVGLLLGARIVQGVATGAAAAAVGAAMIDVDRTRGTLANAVAPMLGTAAGALLGGVLVQYAVAPTQLVYAVLGVE